jgi:hypothetical protein
VPPTFILHQLCISILSIRNVPSFWLFAETRSVTFKKQDYAILFSITALQFFVGGVEWKDLPRFEQNEKWHFLCHFGTRSIWDRQDNVYM